MGALSVIDDGGSMFKSGICLLMFFALVLISCGNDNPKTDARKSDFKFCVLSHGSFTDEGANQRYYEAIQTIAKRRKLNVQYYDNVKSNAVETCINGNPNVKYDFVIAMGQQLIAPLIRISSSHPQLKTAIVGQYPGNFKNFGALSYQPSHHYLAGVVAALKSKNGRIGALITSDQLHARGEMNAFFEGARKVNPDILSYSVSVGELDNKNMVERYAMGMKDNMVDVIFVNCGSAGTDIYAWGAKNKIMTIGSIDDQHAKAPHWVVASVVTNYDKMLSYAVDLMLKGQWQGIQYRFGMAEKATDIAPLRGTLKNWNEDRFYEIYREIAEQKGEIENAN